MSTTRKDAEDRAGHPADRGGRFHFWKTWRRVREEDRALGEADEGFLTRMMTALFVLRRMLPLYLSLALCVLAVQLTFFDNLETTIPIYGGPTTSKTGAAADELARALTEDYNREAASYRWWKSFRSEENTPRATPTTPARLDKLIDEPTALVIIQDGFRPNIADLAKRHQPGINPAHANVQSLDVRAIADLWDSYLHVFVTTDASGNPAFPTIDAIDPKAPIYIGQGAQAALSRKVLCKYGVFDDDDEAKLALDGARNPSDPAQALQAGTMAETIDAVRAGRIKVAFVLTSTADIQKYFEGKRADQGDLHLLPIDRADAIAEEIPFGDVAVLPWHAYQDKSTDGQGERSHSIPHPPEGPKPGAPGERGIKTLKTQTILACSSRLADGVVLGILEAMYARVDFQHFKLHPRPPADQKFLFPMHNASHAFHKAGPAPSFITSPFIVGGLTLILGQLLYISGQLRERKGHLRDREARRRDAESQRFIEKLKHIFDKVKSDSAEVPGPRPPRVDEALHETYEQAAHDFATGRITREGFDRIVELHRLSRQILGRRDPGAN